MEKEKRRNGWRAGYIERCKSGSEGGSQKPILVTKKRRWGPTLPSDNR